MTVIVRWHGEQAQARLRRAAAQAIRQAATLLHTRARLLCNRPAKRIRMRRRRTTKAGPAGSQYTLFIGSAPGQPPMVRTSFGRRHILMEYDAKALTARVGPAENAAYMAYLELGTQRIAPRPWLRRALQETRPAIETLMRSTLERGTK